MVILEVIKGVKPHRPVDPEITEGLWTLLLDCWAFNPEERPTMNKVANSLFKLIDGTEGGVLPSVLSHLSRDDEAKLTIGYERRAY